MLKYQNLRMNAVIDYAKIDSVFATLPSCGYSKKVCEAIIDWYHR